MEDFHRYIWFSTLDVTGVPTTSGYTLPITPFTFIPIFDDGLTDDYSTKRILWDFGDGTKSESITATHSYALPGWYNVKCYVLGIDGIGYEDKFSQNLLVKDFVSDTLVISGFNNKTETGTIQNPFQIYRFNSWQTYPVLSSDGYTIKLHVSGNTAPLLDTENYYKDKWAHLKPSARFETFLYNPLTDKQERLPVNTLVTDNTEIYVKLNNNKELVFCSKNDAGSCLAGTSGSKVFYFIDDIPKKINDITEVVAATIFATFDTSKFKDHDSYGKNYPENLYSVLNSVFDSNSFSVLIEQLNSDHLTITSNGIDDDNNGNRIHTFDIYEEKFTGQKIPFVVKIKNENEIASKYNPILKLNENLSTLNGGDVYIELRDSNNFKIDNVSISANLGILSAETYGGYFKGYLTSDQELVNVHLHAESIPVLQERYLIDTTYGIIGHPQSSKIHDIRVRIDTNDKTKKIIDDVIYDIDSLSGIYTSCVTYNRNTDGSTTAFAWIVDGDRDKVRKYNAENMTLVYDKFNIPSNSSPSNICSDNKGNVWITLYDSISTIRINNLDNSVDRVIVPSLSNIVNDTENTVTPASIDVDYRNNIWISYSNSLSSFIEKYDRDQNFLFRIELTPDYQSTELLTDLSGNAWVIEKDLFTKANELSSKHDKLVRYDEDNGGFITYEIGGSLWNITLDIRGNIWATKNRNEIVHINNTTNAITSFSLNSNSDSSYNNYISDLEGITCTTDNTILVIDNVNRKLHYFNADVNINGFNPQALSFTSVNIPKNNQYQNKITGYGDWNGFRHINKFQHIFGRNNILKGNSNVFSIYSSVSGRYDIRKVNENFDPKEQLKSYRFQDYLRDKDRIYNDFFGTAIGTLTSKPTDLGKLVYEKISNFTDNVANVDTCNVRSLKSMYEMLDETFYTFGSIDYNFPGELNRLVDIFSVNFSKLKGSRNKFDQNFNNRGYHNDVIRANGGTPIYGVNKGEELDFLTSVLTAGKNIVAYEKFSETYTVLNTNLSVASAANLHYIDPVIKTYTLSSYSPYWGWGLVLPENCPINLIPRHYSFYEYISGFNDKQTEGVINWADKQTTISENISSVTQWNKIRENMINYSLAKGLSFIK